MILPRDIDLLRRLAPAAARLWNADDGSVRHIADSGNSVYGLRIDGVDHILRLTSPTYRRRSENEAEVEYLDHLARCGVQVSTALPSDGGALVEDVALDGVTMLASLFRFAPGVYVAPGSEHWNENLFREWGRTLGAIHRASSSFRPAGPARRWHWSEEGFIANAGTLIPADDTASHRELERVLRRISDFPVDERTFGITHADFAPQNFNYDPVGGITAFDFGNCCYHWYISDLAISLSVLRRYPGPEREAYRRWIVEGYRERFPLDDELLAEISWFIRLRILYVYLSRLVKFGPTPTDEEREILAAMRRSVHEEFVWG